MPSSNPQGGKQSRTENRLALVKRQREEAMLRVGTLRDQLDEAADRATTLEELASLLERDESTEVRENVIRELNEISDTLAKLPQRGINEYDEIQAVHGRAEKAEAALADRDNQIAEALHWLEDGETDKAKDALDDMERVPPLGWTQPSYNPPQQDREDGSYSRDDMQEAVEVIDSVFKYLEESGLAEESLKLYEATKPLAQVRVRLAEALLTQPEADPEVPRCGNRDRIERLVKGLRQVAGERHDRAENVSVAAQNVHYAADLIETAFLTEPDCQPTPELLGEEVAHELKCWPPYFEEVLTGRKPFEVRKIEDRWFKVGQTILLREYDGSLKQREPETDGYTGRTCLRRITYILGDGDWGIEKGTVVLGLASTQPVSESPGDSGVEIDGAVELLAERLFRFHAINTGAITRWPDTAEGTRNGWRQDARSHLEAIRHLLTQPVPGNSGGLQRYRVEATSDGHVELIADDQGGLCLVADVVRGNSGGVEEACHPDCGGGPQHQSFCPLGGHDDEALIS